MGSKLCPKVILQGTRLMLKTEMAFESNASRIGLKNRADSTCLIKSYNVKEKAR